MQPVEQFLHYRLVSPDGVVQAQGGVTVFAIFPKSATNEIIPLTLGIAVCSLEDVYNKKLGRVKAQGRSKSARLAVVTNVYRDDIQSVIEGVVAGKFVEMNRRHGVPAPQRFGDSGYTLQLLQRKRKTFRQIQDAATPAECREHVADYLRTL